jgi:hypothetical protein
VNHPWNGKWSNEHHAFSFSAFDMVAEARPGDEMLALRSESKWSPRTPWGDAAIAKKAVIEKQELPVRLERNFFFFSLFPLGFSSRREIKRA